MSKPIIAIIGAPNVGKSTVFNRIVGTRHSIVDDQPGVTRDRIYASGEWLDRHFDLVDTGGIEIANRPFQTQIREQVMLAINEAGIIVFICDGKLGVNKDDMLVAQMLRKTKKPIILAVNKIDDNHMISNIADFYKLGLGDPLAISGAHGIGIGDLLDKIISYFPENDKVDYQDEITFAIIGRPNVGKSSLMNAILNQERVIVSDIEGTTRDSIDTSFIKDGTRYVAIDTAGLKKRGQIYESVDKYASMRALRAIERSEVIVFVIDAHAGLKEQDKHVVGYAIENNKAIVIVVNKWDLMDKTPTLQDEFKKQLKKEMPFLDYSPIIFVSALNKTKINKG